jgi:hypothetical protein
MLSQLARITFTALALIGLVGSAQAAPMLVQEEELLLDNCDGSGCDGVTLYLNVQEFEDNGDNYFIVTYTINSDNYTNGDELMGFNQIGWKAIKDWTLGDPGTTVLSSPTDPLDTWNPIFDDPIASGSLCDTSAGDTDKVCITGYVDITGGGDYTWVFRIEDGTLMDTSEWHLGAQFANSRLRHKGHIISAEVPEPSAALLFALGAIVVTRAARRR